MHDKASPAPAPGERVASVIGWIAALLLVCAAIYLGWQKLSARGPAQAAAPLDSEANFSLVEPLGGNDQASLPLYQPVRLVNSVTRKVNLHTDVPERRPTEVQTYTVVAGDSVFEIAGRFDISPETVLWANYDLLNDNPDLLSIGMELKIPPEDGVIYQWKEGDTIESVAAQFKADPEAILNWTGNNLDLTNPVIEPGTEILIPGGKREFRQWVIPVIPRGKAGVSPNLYGPGTCQGGYEGAYGTGTFIWPAANQSLSGNDFWDGHLAIDIAAGEGAPIYASDSGVVVFAGGAYGGYGNMIMIDHGNGFQTLYAHLSSVRVSCGQSVGQGSIIGYSGSTGNSTGPHLHFEIRYLGGFINPWSYLP